VAFARLTGHHPNAFPIAHDARACALPTLSTHGDLPLAMFDTDLILWLQTSSPDWMLPLMLLVSDLGSDGIYTPVMLALIFAWRVRPGLRVLLALLLAGCLVNAAKEGFALPRPVDVDSRLLRKGEVNTAIVSRGGATSFWALPPADAVQAVRTAATDSYGFVSGHTALAATTTISTVLAFGVRSRAAWSLALLWPLLMGLSRMHLGRHFLADVLGGLLTAGLTLLIVRVVLGRSEPDTTRPRALAGAALATLVLAGASPAAPWLSAGSLGSIAGVLLCLWVLSRTGTPVETTSPWHRLLRFVLAMALGVAVGWTTDGAYAALGLPDAHIAAFPFATLGYAVALLGSMWIARGFGWYARSPVVG
jgi:membrane-associated phospholipid phosphatase